MTLLCLIRRWTITFRCVSAVSVSAAVVLWHMNWLRNAANKVRRVLHAVRPSQLDKEVFTWDLQEAPSLTHQDFTNPSLFTTDGRKSKNNVFSLVLVQLADLRDLFFFTNKKILISVFIYIFPPTMWRHCSDIFSWGHVVMIKQPWVILTIFCDLVNFLWPSLNDLRESNAITYTSQVPFTQETHKCKAPVASSTEWLAS